MLTASSPPRPGSPAAAAFIEADEGLGADEDEFVAVAVDGDAASALSDTTSLQSCAFLHAWENGRRYHRYRHARYPIPNDETEQAREDMLHVMMLEVTDGKLFFSPLGDDPAKIIDLGTGTGIWAIDGACPMMPECRDETDMEQWAISILPPRSLGLT